MNDNTNWADPAEPLIPNRERIDLRTGQYVRHQNTVYRIQQLLGFDALIGTDTDTGQITQLRIAELMPLNNDRENATSSLAAHDLDNIADEDWQIAQYRYSIIKPLVNEWRPGRAAVEVRAEETDNSPASIYRWIKRYRNHGGVVSALVPHKPGMKSGRTGIDPQAEKIIETVINEIYLTVQRPSAANTAREVIRRCKVNGVTPPCTRTVRNRISALSERRKMRERGYREQAKNRFSPATGHFPNADYPLSVIQIDHTPVDIILVDDVHRMPIMRPWLTVAIDIYSRMIVGYYLSFDAPSETSVAMCVAHAVLPKDEWLLMHGVDADWPVWGFPATIHVDNGSDFRSDGFMRSCQQFGIDLQFRPVKAPKYGGHVERVLGTILKEVHSLPGTTFSSIKDRDEYKSDKHAAMTKAEFEKWLVTFICNVYHARKHEGLGVAPIKQWELGIFGSKENPGVGMPSRPADSSTVLLDFLPRNYRTVQTYGVAIDGIKYYDASLRPWINATDPENKNNKRQFTFRRDPRDISAIWFSDPTLNQYFKIPCSDQSIPSLSLWELREAKARLKKQGHADINESLILRALTEMREEVEQSTTKTKKARRKAQRRKDHERKTTPDAPIPAAAPARPSDGFSELVNEDIDGFGDIS